MGRLFYIDNELSEKYSYDDLLKEIRASNTFNKFVHKGDTFEIFKEIYLSLILNTEIVLLDSDFSEYEIESMLEGADQFEEKEIDINSLNNMDIDLNKLGDWRLTLFTSGTTGVPKKVTHTITSICKGVKKSKKHSSDIWGFCYNPTHIAGIQIFFQAILNKNTIVNLFNKSTSIIHKSIEKYNITHLSSTPTFLRLLFPFNGVNKSVVRITSGGEKFDEKLITQFESFFPNAVFRNVYASTELGTMLTSKSGAFSIKDDYKDLIQVENDELIVHESLAPLIKDKIKNGWYYTGDIVKFIDSERFVFSHRENNMANIGGYKVNILEVEEIMENINGVECARVYAKPNSVLGNILMADIVAKELDSKMIKSQLNGVLQDFKIPRIIRIVDEIEKTRTGKKKR